MKTKRIIFRNVLLKLSGKDADNSNAKSIVENAHEKEEVTKKKNIVNNRNNFIKNRNLSASVKFNVNNLENMNTNMIKIVYQKIVQIPAPKVCYFSKQIY